MKAIKEMLGKDLMAKIQNRWGVKLNVIVNDGTKYGSQNDDDRVYNPIIGFSTPKQIKELEAQGVIVWRKESWRVPRVMMMINGKKVFPVYHKFLTYMREMSGKHPDDAERNESLVQQGAEAFGGQVIREP